MNAWYNLIEINPNDDKAYIKGTPVKVGDILESLEAGLSLEQIVTGNPHLTEETVKAAIAYRNRFKYAHC